MLACSPDGQIGLFEGRSWRFNQCEPCFSFRDLPLESAEQSLSAF
jgi:hypothetical protein